MSSNNQGGNRPKNNAGGNAGRNAGGNNLGNNNISFLLNNSLMNGNQNGVNKNVNKNKNRSGGPKGNRSGNYDEMQKQMAMNETLAMMMGARATLGSIEERWEGTPFGVKMGYLFILGAIFYYFTVMNYNIYGMVITGALLAMVVFMWSIFLAIVVGLVVALIIYFKRSERVRLGGYLVDGTEITSDHIVYKGKEDHLFVSSSDLPKEIEVGTFSYSFWLYLNKPPTNGKVYRSGKWKSIFYRGSKLDSKNDLSSLTQYLGVWLKPDDQTLAFVFQQNGSQNESIEFSDIEYGEWMYFVVNCTKNSVNIFKNGKLEISSSLQQNPVSMNDYGIYITSDYGMAQMDLVSGDVSTSAEDDNADNDTGFDGYLAYLTYYTENLGVDEIGTVMSFYQGKVDKYEEWKQKMIESDIDYSFPFLDDQSS